jgi:tetratricopeptide (TPR) repeat protein
MNPQNFSPEFLQWLLLRSEKEDISEIKTATTPTITAFRKAIHWNELGELEQAALYYQEVLKLPFLYPFTALSSNNLAYIFLHSPQLYNPQEALKLAQKANEDTDFQEPEFLDSLAECYLVLKDYPKALETLKCAIQYCQDPLYLKKHLLPRQKKLNLLLSQINNTPPQS